MKQLTTWFKNAVTTFLDQDRESRVSSLVDAIHCGIQSQGQGFVVRDGLIPQEYSEQDLREAKYRVYRSAVERAWGDGVLSSGEKKVASWLAASLKLTSDETRQLDFEQARKRFGASLSQAMQDGVLDDHEEARLRAIAGAVDCDLPRFSRAFFQNEGEAFLRSIFLACVADNQISQADWNYLLHVTQQFGLQHHEMLAAIQPQAMQFVEHVLADAKSDSRITPSERQSLDWLLGNLRLPENFRSYVVNELHTVQAMTDIEDGRLPSIALPGGMEHRSGEIIHWAGQATWREHRQRKDHIQAHDHGGTLALTDNRVIFSSGMKSQSVGYRKIVAHSGGNDWFELQLENKPVSQYFLREPSPFPYAILRVAVAMANQTKLAKLEGGNSRFIPRDVRQRVWQRYGGRCAECGATMYLEFDHIIPVARGGSNTDANVQLLCRMCNLKKSDRI